MMTRTRRLAGVDLERGSEGLGFVAQNIVFFLASQDP